MSRRTSPRNLAGIVVAVTGAARGIGLATAGALVARGARVALGDLDEELVAAEAARLGGGAVGLDLDVTDTDSFAGFLAGAQERLGPLDVLVGNAGIMWAGPFADEPDRAAERQFQVNVLGAARGMRLAAPGMRARGHGHLITIASASSKLAPAGEATYAATKHAIYGYNVAVQQELHGSGVALSVVMPIVVETELALGTTHGKGRRLAPSDVAEAVVATIERPRFDVYVPAAVGALARVLAVLPERPRFRLARFAIPDQVAAGDAVARREYEERTVSGPPAA